MTARRAALNTLLKITEEGAFANLAVKEGLSAVRTNSVGRSTALVYNTLEHLNYCDYIITHYAKGRLHTQIRGILRLAVAELFYMDTPPYAVCSESVQLTCEIGKAGLKGYVNGVLRSVIRDRDSGSLPELPHDPVERLVIETGYPAFIIREHIARFGLSFAEALLKAPHARPAVRSVFPSDIGEVKDHLDELGVKWEQSILRDAVIVDALKGLNDDEFFKNGSMTVQSIGAMIACRCLDPKPGMCVLDACAAPGGKTAYLFDLMNRNGKLSAWDIHPHRVELIKSTLGRLGVESTDVFKHSIPGSGVFVYVKDASVTDEALLQSFDAVLCDVPCSGLGGGTKPDARYRRTEEGIAELAELQYSILDTCSGYVRPDGALVYSTCTVSETENEGVIARFLKAHPEYSLGSLSDYLPDSIKERGNGGIITLFPNVDGTEGFFIARLIKNKQ